MSPVDAYLLDQRRAAARRRLNWALESPCRVVRFGQGRMRGGLQSILA